MDKRRRPTTPPEETFVLIATNGATQWYPYKIGFDDDTSEPYWYNEILKDSCDHWRYDVEPNHYWQPLPPAPSLSGGGKQGQKLKTQSVKKARIKQQAK